MTKIQSIVQLNLSKNLLQNRGHTLYKKEDVTKGKFAFTTDEYDMFEVCFETVKGGGKGREVSLVMKHGVEARNYDDIAKAEKLKPMEVRGVGKLDLYKHHLGLAFWFVVPQFYNHYHLSFCNHYA